MLATPPSSRKRDERAPASRRRPGARAGVLLLALAASSCAHNPNGVATAVTMASVGTALAVGGGAAWAIGDRRDQTPLIVPGVIAVAAGVIGIIAAGVVIAGSVACTADADCPTGQACRAVPAGAGREPYAQCVPR